MAREKVAKAEIDPEADAHAPRTREEVVQHYRQRRQSEPAHSPFETDDEAGNASGRYAGAPLERDATGRPRDPARAAAPGGSRRTRRTCPPDPGMPARRPARASCPRTGSATVAAGAASSSSSASARSSCC